MNTPPEIPENTPIPPVKWKRWLIGVGIGITVIAGGGMVYGWYFVKNQLTPLVADNLSKTFDRPVTLGSVESFSFHSVTFGNTQLPPTSTDADSVSVEKIKVGFSFLPLIFQKRLNLDITLVQPTIYVEKGENGLWVATRIHKGEGKYKTNIDRLKLESARVTLVGRNKQGKSYPPVDLFVNGEGNFSDENKNLHFMLQGNLEKSDLKLEGKINFPKKEIVLQVQGEALSALAVSFIVPFGFQIKAGNLDSDLGVKFQDSKIVEMEGKVWLDKVGIQVGKLPQSFTDLTGRINFKGMKLQLPQMRGTFGKIPAITEGIITLNQGLSLTAVTQPIPITDFAKSLKINKLPVPIQGQIQGKIQVTGKTENPLLVAQLVTSRNTIIDKISFNSIQAEINIIESSLIIRQFQAIPTSGGVMGGRGQVSLKNKEFLIGVQGKDLATVKLIQLYNKTFDLPVGKTDGNLIILGNLNSPKAVTISGSALSSYQGISLAFNQIQTEGKQWKANMRVAGLALNQLPINLDKIPTAFHQGKLQANLNLSGVFPRFNLTKINGQGIALMTLKRGQLYAQSLQFSQGKWLADLQIRDVPLENFSPDISDKYHVPLYGRFVLRGDLNNPDTRNISGQGIAQFKAEGGLITLSQINIGNGFWQAFVQAQGLQFASLKQPLNGIFRLAGKINNFKEIEGIGKVGLYGGVIDVTAFRLDHKDWIAKLRVNSIALRQFSAKLPPQLNGLFSGLFEFKGNLDRNNISSIEGVGQAETVVAKGIITASNIRISNGNLTTRLSPRGINLGQISKGLKGIMGGEVNLTAKLTDIRPETLNLEGIIQFSQGVSLLNRPLQSQFQWSNSRLNIIQATASGFKSQGYIDFNWDNFNPSKPLSVIKDWNLSINAENVYLADLSSLMENRPIQGQLSFNGMLLGNPETPNINATLKLRNFSVDRIAFDSLLQGKLQANRDLGLNFTLEGEQDHINYSSDKTFLPSLLSVKVDDVIAEAKRQQENWIVTTSNFPLPWVKSLVQVSGLNVTPSFLKQPLSGKLNGLLTFGLINNSLAGTVTISNPIIGSIHGNQLTGQFAWSEDNLQVRQLVLSKNESRYQLDGKVASVRNNPYFDGNLDINQGEIQDILTTLQIFDLSDITRFREGTITHNNPPLAEIFPSPLTVGYADSPLSQQLRRFSEIQSLLRQQKQKKNQSFSLPELSELTGTLDGSIAVKGTVKQGLSAKINLMGGEYQASDKEKRGRKLQWGNYIVQNMQIKGDFQDGKFTFTPILINLENQGNIIISGLFGGDNQQGQIIFKDIPIDFLQEVIKLPSFIGFGGVIDGNIAIQGDTKNPQAIGTVDLVNATLNNIPVEKTRGTFNYSNAYLDFAINSLLKANTDPITVRGKLPYQLPFADVSPSQTELSLDINLKDQGLALINILTKGQLQWMSGKGNINLNISGNIDPKEKKTTALIAKGVANLDQATLTSSVLPDFPFTDVKGKINFNLDTVQVEEITGKFGGGSVKIAGNIPLLKPVKMDNPLTVELNQLALNLRGLYKGGVQGNLQILETVLDPTIAGNLELFKGQILLSEAKPKQETNPNDRSFANITEFKNLQIKLGDQLQITRPPILNFLAQGSLTVNGTLRNLEPQGTIQLKRGQVNLFTTQFRLAGGYQHTAQFFPEQGLDPFINVRLIASVTESKRSLILVDPVSAEVNDAFNPNIEEIQTIRIQARAEGFASQLTENLELTSSPPRNETEIVELIGGGFINTFGRGDTTLGLANLAGSALLSTVQDTIGQALGLSEFRIFPTLTNNGKETQGTSRLALGAEASIDIGQKMSFSILKILTTDDNPQYGLRYRLNDQTLLRGSTDLSGDNRATIEFEQRF